MAELGAKTKKSFGQHFLIDEKVLRDVVEAGEITKGENVLEIGPGLGVLTGELLGAGAKVTAIEKDKKFAAFLKNSLSPDASTLSPQRRLGSSSKKGMDSSLHWNDKTGLNIIQGDAAKPDWDTLMPNKWKLIANLPYAITSFTLRKALTAKHPPEKIVVLIQKEVAERALAKNGKQSLLSLMVALNSESARIVRLVGKGAFYPSPKVQSAVLEIIPLSQKDRKKKWGVDTEKVMKMAKQGFQHPRKKVISNLKSLSPEIETVFEKLNLSPNARAENIQPADWVRIFKEMD